MNNRPLATIAFVYRERLSSTLSCLEHLLHATKGSYELICIDGGSDATISEPLRKLASDYGFTLIRSEQYLSPNESRNFALQSVRTPYVVFIDNDVVVCDNWLEPLVRCAEQTNAGIVAPLYMQSFRGAERIHMFGGTISVRDENGHPVYSEKHQMQFSRLADRIQLVRQTTGLVEFHAMLMDMELYRQLGPLDEKLFNMSEHADLCMAVTKAGREIYLEPDSVITYQIPERLEPVDKDFFALRWSEAWTQASLSRLAEKYSIPLEQQGLREAGVWCRLHRQKVTATYPRLRKLLGASVHKYFRRRIGQPLEKRFNLHRYPVTGYVANRTVESKIVSV